MKDIKVGYGNEATWSPSGGHVHDPRTEEISDQELEDFAYEKMVDSIEDFVDSIGESEYWDEFLNLMFEVMSNYKYPIPNDIEKMGNLFARNALTHYGEEEIVEEINDNKRDYGEQNEC